MQYVHGCQLQYNWCFVQFNTAKIPNTGYHLVTSRLTENWVWYAGQKWAFYAISSLVLVLGIVFTNHQFNMWPPIQVLLLVDYNRPCNEYELFWSNLHINWEAFQNKHDALWNTLINCSILLKHFTLNYKTSRWFTKTFQTNTSQDKLIFD